MNDATYPWMFLHIRNHGLNHLCNSSKNKSTKIKTKRYEKVNWRLMAELIHMREYLSAGYYKEVPASLSTVCWPVW